MDSTKMVLATLMVAGAAVCLFKGAFIGVGVFTALAIGLGWEILERMDDERGL